MEARDDEREALDTVIRKHWVATPGEFREVLLAWMQTEGYRKHPELEITNEMVERAADAVARETSKLIWLEGHYGIARAALEAALRVPVGDPVSGEGEQ